MSKLTTLRTCASCEWVFKLVDGNPECPKCNFGSYGARCVYGNQAYSHAKTQKPWKDNKLFSYHLSLEAEIRRSFKLPNRLL